MPSPEHLDIPPRRPLGGIVAAVVVVIVLLAAAGVGITLLLRSAHTTAPDLRGLTLQEASAAADKAGVAFLARGESDSATALVVGQDPAPGTEMSKGEVVRVDLAKPPALVVVPDALGLTTERARALIEATGLRPGALREDTAADAPVGVVTRQDPAAGTEVPAGASVAFWVAGAPTVIVPDLSGLTREEAEATATAAGMSVRFLPEVTDEVMPGLIFRQSPQAGTRMSPGSQIVAVVNDGSSDSETVSPGETVGADAVPAPSVVFAALARTYPFPVLYPTFLPAGFILQAGPDNPGHRTGPAATQGFEATYTSADDPGRIISLLEGDWFDPGLEQPTTIDIRGVAAALEEAGETAILVWSENGTRYAVSATGVPRSDVLALAAGLRPAAR